MLKRFVYILLLFIQANAFGQLANWAEATSPKQFKVLLPSGFTLDLPTSNGYHIGYFVYDSGTQMLTCVSRKPYKPGVADTLLIGTDNLGNLGYINNQRLISLVRDSVTFNTYAVEFEYVNNRNYCVLGSTTTVKGVLKKSWNSTQDIVLCNNQSNNLIDLIPYGIFNITIASSSGGLSYTNPTSTSMLIDPGASLTDTHAIVYSLTGSINITRTFPQNVVVNSYPLVPTYFVDTICIGGNFKVPQLNSANQIQRNYIAPNNSFVLTTPGKHIFNTVYTNNGCTSKDTFEIIQRTDCIVDANNQPVEIIKTLFRPGTGDKLAFNKNEIVKILDVHFNKVAEFQSPFVWEGTDNNGNTLSVGIYFVVHEDQKIEYVTIAY